MPTNYYIVCKSQNLGGTAVVIKYLKNKYDNWKYQNKTVTKVGGRRRKARKIIKTRKTRRRKNKK